MPRNNIEMRKDVEVKQQGDEYTQEQKDEIVKSLQPYLELGYSRNMACKFIGFTPQTLSGWLKADNALLMKVISYENKVSARARKNIIDKIEADEPDLETSKWWAERKDRKDFSTRVEQGFDDEQIEKVTVEIITKNNEIKPTSDTDISEDEGEQSENSN